MIILQELEWDKCFSYGENNKLVLNDSTLTQLVGLNGAGKSSLPAIIEEALYNKNSKGCKRAGVPNRNLDGTYSIKLVFSKDEDLYTIKVKRTSSTNIKLLKNGQDISSHTATNTYKQIESIIGMDFKTFSQLIYQNAKTSLQFLTSTDTTRKKFLVDLLGLEKYVEYHEQFKSISKDINSKITSARAKIETYTAWIEDASKTSLDILEEKQCGETYDEEAKELATLELKLSNIVSTNRAISKNNTFKAQLANMVLEPEVSKLDKIDTSAISTEIGTLKADISNSNSFIKKITLLEDKCPTCSQKIDETFKNDILSSAISTVESLQKKLDILSKELTASKNTNERIDRARKSESEFESLYRSIDHSLTSEQLDADALKKDIIELTSIIDRKKKIIEKVNKDNISIAKHNSKVSVILEQITDTKNNLDKLLLEVEPLEQLSSNLEILKKAFSTNGLLAYKIENLVKELEDIVNDYLVDMSEGRFGITFSVNNDKLDVEITDNGTPTDIESLSSGELARVNTSTLLAIRRLMTSISKSQINVLFLDEVIAVLDLDGREKLVDLLMKEDYLNTFIVSHEWTHPLLSKVIISKSQGISRIDNGGF